MCPHFQPQHRRPQKKQCPAGNGTADRIRPLRRQENHRQTPQCAPAVKSFHREQIQYGQRNRYSRKTYRPLSEDPQSGPRRQNTGSGSRKMNAQFPAVRRTRKIERHHRAVWPEGQSGKRNPQNAGTQKMPQFMQNRRRQKEKGFSHPIIPVRKSVRQTVRRCNRKNSTLPLRFRTARPVLPSPAFPYSSPHRSSP